MSTVLKEFKEEVDRRMAGAYQLGRSDGIEAAAQVVFPAGIMMGALITWLLVTVTR